MKKTIMKKTFFLIVVFFSVATCYGRTDLEAWDAGTKKIKQGYINKQKESYNVINVSLTEQAGFIDKYALKNK
jgi:hypothetical protein